MFGLSMNGCHIWCIDSYDDAVVAFNRGAPVRNDPGTHRVPGKEGSRVMWIIQHNDRIVFRYHRTDVVTWHPDNTYTLVCWGSNATDTFANRFLPRGHYLSKASSILQIGDVIYPVRDEVRVSAHGTILRMPKSRFATQRVDRDKASAALAETKYAEYRQWYNVTYPMLRSGGGLQRRYAHVSDVLEMLADQSQWYDLMHTTFGDPDTLRKAIYDKNWCYRDAYADTLPSTADISRWRVVDGADV